MKYTKNITFKNSKNKKSMTEDEIRVEKLSDNIKEQLLNKNIIDKYCRLGLGMLFIVVVLTMILLTFDIVAFKLSAVLNTGKLLIFEILFVFIIMFIKIKNEDKIINKFLDELENN
ncbi:MAG: hypothetical protein IJ086_15890 [Clostridium sp.]|nr:hypothetical protein [Clostridium sp.]MBQ9000156.1 hypothetical protein [Clostridium sp.]